MGLAVVEAELTVAPHVPPPIARRDPVLLRVKMDSQVTEAQLEPPQSYDFWTFSGTVPGPFIRARVGDTMEARPPTHVSLSRVSRGFCAVCAVCAVYAVC
jgi:FtsP/CotA-like multicopper oxidase with cupredoxin domain